MHKSFGRWTAEELEKIRNKWHSADVRLSTRADFSTLFLTDKVIAGLNNAGYKRPSPIQFEAIPLGLLGQDLVVQAKSGTGKTLVYVTLALQRLLPDVPFPQVLIVVPAREVATQIRDVVRLVGAEFKELKCESVIGGLAIDQDERKILGCQIIVGTPGRLKQLINLGMLPLHAIHIFVLDEVDQLLRDAFKIDINSIFESLPDKKQMIATSATSSREVRCFVKSNFKNPKMVQLNKNEFNKDELSLIGMHHYLTEVKFQAMAELSYQGKLVPLQQILKSVDFEQCIVYSNSANSCNMLSYDIQRWGFKTTYICSVQRQVDRTKAIDQFKNYRCKVLISSDVTSRGIDVENVNLVINFDVPLHSNHYFHRCGRAGRYGTKGVAISIVTSKDIKAFISMVDYQKLDIYRLPDPVPQTLIKLSPLEEWKVVQEICDIQTDANLKENELDDVNLNDLDKQNQPVVDIIDCSDFDIPNSSNGKDADFEGIRKKDMNSANVKVAELEVSRENISSSNSTDIGLEIITKDLCPSNNKCEYLESKIKISFENALDGNKTEEKTLPQFKECYSEDTKPIVSREKQIEFTKQIENSNKQSNEINHGNNESYEVTDVKNHQCNDASQLKDKVQNYDRSLRNQFQSKAYFIDKHIEGHSAKEIKNLKSMNKFPNDILKLEPKVFSSEPKAFSSEPKVFSSTSMVKKSENKGSNEPVKKFINRFSPSDNREFESITSSDSEENVFDLHKNSSGGAKSSFRRNRPEIHSTNSQKDYSFPLPENNISSQTYGRIKFSHNQKPNNNYLKYKKGSLCKTNKRSDINKRNRRLEQKLGAEQLVPYKLNDETERNNAYANVQKTLPSVTNFCHGPGNCKYKAEGLSYSHDHNIPFSSCIHNTACTSRANIPNEAYSLCSKYGPSSFNGVHSFCSKGGHSHYNGGHSFCSKHQDSSLNRAHSFCSKHKHSLFNGTNSYCSKHGHLFFQNIKILHF